MKSVNFRYLKSVELNGFNGGNNILWQLSTGVNILSGSNGSGKSTLIQALIKLFKKDYSLYVGASKPYDNIVVTFEDSSQISSIDNGVVIMENVDVVSTFDIPLKISEAVKHLTSSQVVSDLDWELYRSLERYLRYKLALGKQVIDSLLSGGDRTMALELIAVKDQFLDLIDSMFNESGKRVSRDSDDLIFETKGGVVTPFQLSSGEKQLLIIFITVLTQNRESSILIMDEPEISLHHSWQRKLISNIMVLNPNIQLITTTHSPALIMDGWMDSVTDMSEIFINK